MSWVAVAAAGASIVGGLISSRNAGKAADASVAGSQAAIAEQARQFDLIRSDTGPARQLGASAIDRLNRLYGYAPATQALPAPASTTGVVAPTSGGMTSGAAGIIGRALSPSTAASGLVDPIGGVIRSFSGQPMNARGILDPAGLFGGGKKQSFPQPAGAGPSQFKPSDIIRLKGQGLSPADILKMGFLTPNQGAKELNALRAAGISDADIQSLMSGVVQQPNVHPGGPSGPVTIDGATGAVIEPGKPDMSAFFESPDYQFNLGEGQKAIDRSLVARGRGLSGAGVKEGVRYASGAASNEYGNFVSRLMTQAGLGETGVNTSANAGLTTSSNIGNALQNQGNARASGYAGKNEAVQGTLGNLLTLYLSGAFGRQPVGG